MLDRWEIGFAPDQWQGLWDHLTAKNIGEDLILPSVESWWCGDGSSKSHVLANLDTMVLRPTSRRRGGSTIDAAKAASVLATLGGPIDNHPTRPATIQ